MINPLLPVFFLAGIFLGSFVNMLIDRLPRGEDIVWSRSHCDRCGHVLWIPDLVPVFSFIFLRGRCRYCRKRIAPRNLVVELAVGCGAAAIAAYYGFSALGRVIPEILIFACLTAVFLIDLRHRIIPDGLTVAAAILALILHSQSGWYQVSQYTAAGAVFAGFFLLLFAITRGRGMGLGDVKFAFFMGFYLGLIRLLTAFYLAFLTGSVVSLILIFRGRKSLKSTVAFGPFLVFATLVARYFGFWMFAVAAKRFF